MARTGKIAHLPHHLREQLNRRLADGEPGVRLLAWLNSLPEVQAILARDFAGRPINPPNLSEWKQGGYEDWLQRQDAHAWVAQIIEESDDLEAAAGSTPLADRTALAVTVALGRLLQQTATCIDPAEKARAVLGISDQLNRLCRAHRALERSRLATERLAFAQKQALSSPETHPKTPPISPIA
jgi:hypothetical protein